MILFEKLLPTDFSVILCISDSKSRWQIAFDLSFSVATTPSASSTHQKHHTFMVLKG